MKKIHRKRSTRRNGSLAYTKEDVICSKEYCGRALVKRGIGHFTKSSHWSPEWGWGGEEKIGPRASPRFGGGGRGFGGGGGLIFTGVGRTTCTHL